MIFTTRHCTVYLLALITLLSTTTITHGFSNPFKETPDKAVEKLAKKLDTFRADVIKITSKTFITTFDEQGREATNLSNIGNSIEELVKQNEERAQKRLTRLKEAITKAIEAKDEANRDHLEKAFLNDEISEDLRKRFNGEKVVLSDSDESKYRELLERVPTIARIPSHKTELFKLPQLRVLLEHLEKIVTFRVGKKTLGIKRDSKQQNLMEEFKEKVEKHGSKMTSLPAYTALENQLTTTFDILKKAQAEIIGHLEKLGIPERHFTSDDDNSMRKKIQELLKQTKKISGQVKKVKRSGRWFKSKKTWKNILTQAKEFNEKPWRSALQSPLFKSDSSRDPALVTAKKGKYSYLELDFVFEPGGSKNGLYRAMDQMNNQVSEILAKLEEQRPSFLTLPEDEVYMSTTVTEEIRGTEQEITLPPSKNLAERRLTSGAQRTYWGYWWSRVMSYHNMFYSSGIRTVYFRLIAHEALKKLNEIAPLADRGENHSRADRYLQITQGKDPKSPEVYNAIAEVATNVRKNVLTYYNIQMNNILAQFDYLNQAPEYKAFVKQARLVLNTIDRTAQSPFFRHVEVKKERWLQYNGLNFDGTKAKKGDPEYQTAERGKTTLRHLFPHADTVTTSEANELHSNVSDERMSDYSAEKEIEAARDSDYLSAENVTATLNTSQAYNEGYVAGTADRDDNRRRPADYKRSAQEKYPEYQASQNAYIEGYLDGWSGARRSKYDIRRLRQRGVDKKMNARVKSRDEEEAYDEGYRAAEGDRTEKLKHPDNYENTAKIKYRDSKSLQTAYIDGYLDGWAEERRSAKGNKKNRHARGRAAMGQRSYDVDEHDSHEVNTKRGRRGMIRATGLLQRDLNDRRRRTDDDAIGQDDVHIALADEPSRELGIHSSRAQQEAYEDLQRAFSERQAEEIREALIRAQNEAERRRVLRSYQLRLHPDKGGDTEQFQAVTAFSESLNASSEQPTSRTLEDRYSQDERPRYLAIENERSVFGPKDNQELRQRERAEREYAEQHDAAYSSAASIFENAEREERIASNRARFDREFDARPAQRTSTRDDSNIGRARQSLYNQRREIDAEFFDNARRKSAVRRIQRNYRNTRSNQQWDALQQGARDQGRNELISHKERSHAAQRRWRTAGHAASSFQRPSIKTTRIKPQQLPPPPQYTPKTRNTRFVPPPRIPSQHGPSQPEHYRYGRGGPLSPGMTQTPVPISPWGQH